MLYAIIIIGSWLMTTCGIFVFLTLSNTEKPLGYGRYSDSLATTRTLPPTISWMIQGFPSFIIPFYLYWTNQHLTEYGSFLTCLMTFHYAYRSFVYPFIINSDNQSPVKIVIMAFGFSVLNGFIQGTWNAFYQPEFDTLHPKFFVFLGAWLFVVSCIL